MARATPRPIRVASAKPSASASAICGPRAPYCPVVPWARTVSMRPPAEAAVASVSLAARAAGKPAMSARRVATVCPRAAARVEPTRAVPSADPTCRAVLWVAEPEPDCAGGTAARTVEVSWAEARPSPTP